MSHFISILFPSSLVGNVGNIPTFFGALPLKWTTSMTFVGGHGLILRNAPVVGHGQGMVCSTFWPLRVRMAQRRRWNCIVIASEMAKIPLRKPFSRLGCDRQRNLCCNGMGHYETCLCEVVLVLVTFVWLWSVMMKYLLDTMPLQSLDTQTAAFESPVSQGLLLSRGFLNFYSNPDRLGQNQLPIN